VRSHPRLLLDAGPYSLGADTITGIGVRIAELAQTLAAEFPVLVMVDDVTDCVPVDPAQLVSTVDWRRMLAGSDVVFFFDMPETARLEAAVRGGNLIVTENAPPVEHLEYPSLLGAPDPAAVHRDLVAAFARQLQVSHHFLCRSQVERVALIASLCVAGRLGPDDVARSRVLEHLVSTIPIGFSAASAAAAVAADARPLADVLWTGGLWSYFDPLLLVEAIAKCHARGVMLTAAFLYAQATRDSRESVRRVAARVDQLGLRDAIRLCDRPPRHQERDSIVKGARALVCVARPGIENETCVRLRIRDSRLYGVPTIVDSSGPTATELLNDGLGRVLSSNSADELADALVGAAAGHAAGRARDSYCYDRTVANLTAWLEGARNGT
jgi:hypothetical protein